MESLERIHEEGETLAKGTIITTSSGQTSPAEPIKKTRLFSLATSLKSAAATAVTGRSSTQLDMNTSPIYPSRNLNTSNCFFEPDSLPQTSRPKLHEEKDPADPYYSPPSTFMPPESPNNMRVEDQASLATLSSEAKVRESYLSIIYNTDIQNLRQ